MGLFVHEDPYYDPNVRQVGFNRYKQLLSRHAFSWIKLNLLTVLGALPLAAGIGYAILSSSILVLIPISILGGMIGAPFWLGSTTAYCEGCGTRRNPGGPPGAGACGKMDGRACSPEQSWAC